MRVKNRGAQMKKTNFWKDNGLTLTMFGLFLFSIIGQFFTGFVTFNDDMAQHAQKRIGIGEYFISGHFVESVMENWESEFLQMGLYVILSVMLYQRGSSESNPAPDEHRHERKHKRRYFAGRPVLRKLYENSLSIALLSLFAFSFLFHSLGGWKQENLQRTISPVPQPPLSWPQFVGSSEFWFQSFQNWQSEFLSVGVLVILSVFLRQKGSAQSKPVDMPHWRTTA